MLLNHHTVDVIADAQFRHDLKLKGVGVTRALVGRRLSTLGRPGSQGAQLLLLLPHLRQAQALIC